MLQHRYVVFRTLYPYSYSY